MLVYTFDVILVVLLAVKPECILLAVDPPVEPFLFIQHRTDCANTTNISQARRDTCKMHGAGGSV